MLALKPFKSIHDLLKAFPTEQSCIEHLERIRWNGKVVSPYVEGGQVYKCKAKNRYKCKASNKYFNARTNTIFEGTKIPLQTWFLATFLFATHKRGISSYQLATDLNITQKTAWFMLSRLRYASEHCEFSVDEDEEIQADETFIGGKNKNRHWDKKVKGNQGRSFKDKTPVFGMKKANGDIKTIAIPDTKAETIQPIIYSYVIPGATIKTDEWKAYNGLNKYYNHLYTDHSKGKYVTGEATTNAVENAWAHFKRMIVGTYFIISRKHLQKYCYEFDFRFNNRHVNTEERFNLLLRRTSGKRITYDKLIERT